MSEGLRNINLMVAVAGMVIALIGLVEILLSRYLKDETKAFFLSFFCILGAYTAFILTRALTHYLTGYGWATVSKVAFFFQAFLSSILTVLITGFLLYQSGERRWYINPLFFVSILLWLVYASILIYAQFSKLIYYVDDNNGYHRGPYFGIIMVAPILIMIVNIFVLYRKRDSLSSKQRRAFLSYTVIPIFAMILQLELFGIQFIVLGTAIGALVMYTYIYSEQSQDYIQKERENEQLKTDILLAQIHPQFMFNSLATIKHLCKEDPDRAADAIDEFTSYLRDHMDSITIDSPIPFGDELNLVQEYLSLQMMRCGSALTVGYDLQHFDFSLPTLTLEPLVENAVVHGICGSERGKGKVMIRTKLAGDHVELAVEDDGAGFDMGSVFDEGHSHKGISNVRERLMHVSKGELRIESEPGKGTKAVISLPLDL